MSEKQLFRIKKTQDILNSLKVLFFDSKSFNP